MVIISEVTAICRLLLKAAEFSAQIRDGLYKGSAELKEFPAKVAILSVKHAQWTSQLEKFGMTEDEHLEPLVKAAAEILDKEQDYVSRMQKSRIKRFIRRAFPGQLTYTINAMVEIVDAGRKQLEERVQTNDLLERDLDHTPYPLPFGPDRKYVPLLASITDVQKALEDVDGSLVVTVHAGPGMGKSSLVKYLALHYQKQKQQMAAESATPVCFPDGVFYLLCGRGAQARVKELQMNLLASLGGGPGSSTQLNDWPGPPKQDEEFMHLPSTSHRTKLTFRLRKQKSLIILDDVWEVEVLKELLVYGEKVKYLVTSQIRTICSHATFIELKRPNEKEARKILANYTEGLPIKGEFPDNIQNVTDSIIRELEYHPLSLANVGTTIDRRRATDFREWIAVTDYLREQLDENDFHDSQLIYGTTYSLTVGASMMLMVDSLRPEARHLLLLMGLLNERVIPEVLVKFLLNQIQSTSPRHQYRRNIMYLEDRSLVEYRTCYGSYDVDVVVDVDTSRPALVTHDLRMYYIRKNHTVDLTSIATEILSSGSESSNHHGGELVESGYTDKALATIMGAMYFEEPFRDVVATRLESESRIFSGGVIPRSMSSEVDVLDLMNRTEDLKYCARSLVWLLNPDGEGGWKQQAHHYAKKLVIVLMFQRKLDDESMATLIQLPHATKAACQALSLILGYLWLPLENAFVHQNITFSSAHGQTMKSLMCLLHDNVASPKRRAAAISVLGYAFPFESDHIILSSAKKWVEFLAKDSNTTLQEATTKSISPFQNMNRLSRATILMGEVPGLLDHLLMLVVEGRNSEAFRTLDSLCRSNTIKSKIAAIPGALESLYRVSLLNKQFLVAGDLLSKMFNIPDNRVIFSTMSCATVHDCLKRLLEVLTKNPELHTDKSDLEGPLDILARLAMTHEVRETISVTFSEFQEVLRLLQLSYFSRSYHDTVYRYMVKHRDPQNRTSVIAVYEYLVKDTIIYEIRIIGRALTILDPLQTSLKITTVPLSPPRICYNAYIGQVTAYQEMKMYSEAFDVLNMAHEYYQQLLPSTDSWGRHVEVRDEVATLRLPQIFLKAMLEDYDGAMRDANNLVESFPVLPKDSFGNFGLLLGERGVLKRLGGADLGEALADLDEALKYLSHFNYDKRYHLLKHRGLVKLMIGDEVGARADAESAHRLNFLRLVLDTTDNALGPKHLCELPVQYLGFSL